MRDAVRIFTLKGTDLATKGAVPFSPALQAWYQEIETIPLESRVLPFSATTGKIRKFDTDSHDK
jgi:hypothetical protein